MLNLAKSRSFYLEFCILFSASIQTWQLKILSLQQKFGPFFSLPVMQVYHVWLRNQRLDLKGHCGFHSFNDRMHDNCHYKVQLPILPVLKLGIVFYYKVRRLLYKTVRQLLLQIDGYYIVRRVSQSAGEHSISKMTFFSLENYAICCDLF